MHAHIDTHLPSPGRQVRIARVTPREVTHRLGNRLPWEPADIAAAVSSHHGADPLTPHGATEPYRATFERTLKEEREKERKLKERAARPSGEWCLELARRGHSTPLPASLPASLWPSLVSLSSLVLVGCGASTISPSSFLSSYRQYHRPCLGGLFSSLSTSRHRWYFHSCQPHSIGGSSILIRFTAPMVHRSLSVLSRRRYCRLPPHRLPSLSVPLRRCSFRLCLHCADGTVKAHRRYLCPHRSRRSAATFRVLRASLHSRSSSRFM